MEPVAKSRKSKSLYHARGCNFDKDRVVEDIMNINSRDKLNVFCTTWNMGNAEAEGLNNIFHEDNHTNNYDIFAIGLQESTYSIKGANNDCIAHLGGQFEAALGSKFYIVAHCIRAQLQLYVFARRSLKPRISAVEMSIENTGFLHVFPNKGGLLVTMKIDGTRLAFVSCHLAAHEGVNFCEERNASIVEILGGVRAGDKRLDITEQFHHVFWMGDMNYRITFDNVNVPANTKKNVKKLHDQFLEIEVSMGADIPDMEKVPSYRAAAGEDFSDSDSDTDRILDKIDLSMASEDDIADAVEKFTEHDRGKSKDLPSGPRTPRLSESGSTLNSRKHGDEKDPKERQRSAAIRRTHNMIVLENWEELLQFDELNREMKAGRVLNGFVALQPKFPPTFKRARGLIIEKMSGALASTSTSSNIGKEYQVYANDDKFDGARIITNFYNEKRMPSYTDRILFKSMDTFRGCVVPLFFDSCETATSSDHKPVRAGFEVYLSKGEQGIFIDKQVLNWVGKVSRKTSEQRSDISAITMTISDLKGTNLEELDTALFGGGSDPYVIFTLDPSSALLYKGTFRANNSGLRTKTIWHNLNPEWKDSMTIMLASVDLKGLARNATLIISVWDEDRYNADDIIGVYTIPIREILRAFSVGKSYDFDEQVRTNSEVMGRISGKITVEGNFDELLSAYVAMEQDRLSTERYITLEHAATLHPGTKSGCNCSVS